MKYCAFFIAVCISYCSPGQRLTENIIIVTTDGLRWQEVFEGMDSAIANNSSYHEGDSEYIFKKYWAAEINTRRKKLLPFMWTTVASKGQLLGNREKNNKVDNANPHWFSYPGYSEFMTGYADTAINSNSFAPNPHVTVLEFLHNQPKLRGKIAAFGAWNAFDRILNESRSGITVINGYDTVTGKNLTASQQMVNKLLKDSYRPWGEEECLDVFTHHLAFEYLKSKKPKVLYIAYGETDEWAHSGKYRSYLDAANQVDKWLQDIWNFIQNDPAYKNKTTLVVTTDHGRGDLIKSEWTSHGKDIVGSGQTWIVAIGPDSPARGEVDSEAQLYQQQVAQTVAKLMGYTYQASHPVANEILYFFKMKK